MWKVILVVSTVESANSARGLLTDAGIAVKATPLHKEDKSIGHIELLVPETEVTASHKILVENDL